MNKIERAIYDAEMHIKDKERKVLILQTELNAYREQLQTLELIRDDKHIPHQSAEKLGDK